MEINDKDAFLRHRRALVTSSVALFLYHFVGAESVSLLGFRVSYIELAEAVAFLATCYFALTYFPYFQHTRGECHLSWRKFVQSQQQLRRLLSNKIGVEEERFRDYQIQTGGQIFQRWGWKFNKTYTIAVTYTVPKQHNKSSIVVDMYPTLFFYLAWSQIKFAFLQPWHREYYTPWWLFGLAVTSTFCLG